MAARTRLPGRTGCAHACGAARQAAGAVPTYGYARYTYRTVLSPLVWSPYFISPDRTTHHTLTTPAHSANGGCRYGSTPPSIRRLRGDTENSDNDGCLCARMRACEVGRWGGGGWTGVCTLLVLGKGSTRCRVSSRFATSRVDSGRLHTPIRAMWKGARARGPRSARPCRERGEAGNYVMTY